MSKKLRDMDKEAAIVSAKLEEYASESVQQLRNTTQLPVFEETRYRTQRCLDKISEMVKPTLESMTNQRTKTELVERIYRRLSRPLNAMNNCMVHALDHHDALICQRSLIDAYENIFPVVEEILRDY